MALPLSKFKALKLPKVFEQLDKKQKRILISALIFALVIFICYKVIYKNARRRVAYYNNRVQEITAQNELRKELSGLDSIKEGYQGLVVHTGDIDRFKNELSKLALSSGTRVTSIRSVRKPGPGNYIIFYTTVELKSSYHQLGNFIASIENAQPYIGIENIKFESIKAVELTRWERKPEITEIEPEGETAIKVKLLIRSYSLRK